MDMKVCKDLVKLVELVDEFVGFVEVKEMLVDLKGGILRIICEMVVNNDCWFVVMMKFLGE